MSWLHTTTTFITPHRCFSIYSTLYTCNTCNGAFLHRGTANFSDKLTTSSAAAPELSYFWKDRWIRNCSRDSQIGLPFLFRPPSGKPVCYNKGAQTMKCILFVYEWNFSWDLSRYHLYFLLDLWDSFIHFFSLKLQWMTMKRPFINFT